MPNETTSKHNILVQSQPGDWEEISRRVETLKRTVTRSVDEANRKIKTTTTEQTRLTSTLREQKSRVDSLTAAYQKLNSVVVKTSTFVGNLFTATMRLGSVGRSAVSGLTSAFSGLHRIVNILTLGMAGLITTMGPFMLFFSGVGAIKVGVGSLVEYQTQFQTTAAILLESGKLGAGGLQLLNQQAKELAESMPVNMLQVANAQNVFARAGRDVQEILQAMVPTVKAAILAGIEPAQAADLASSVLASFKRTAKDLPEIFDRITTTSVRTKSSFVEIAEAAAHAGKVGTGLRMDMGQVLGILGGFHEAGIRGSTAGYMFARGMQNMVATLSGSKSGKAGLIAKLEAMGVNMERFSATAVDANVLLEELTGKGIEYLDVLELFEIRATPGYFNWLNDGIIKFKELVSAIDNSEGSLDRMVDTMLEGFIGAWLRAKSLLENATLVVAQSMIPTLEILANVVGNVSMRVERFFSGANPNQAFARVFMTAWQYAWTAAYEIETRVVAMSLYMVNMLNSFFAGVRKVRGDTREMSDWIMSKTHALLSVFKGMVGVIIEELSAGFYRWLRSAGDKIYADVINFTEWFDKLMTDTIQSFLNLLPDFLRGGRFTEEALKEKRGEESKEFYERQRLDLKQDSNEFERAIADRVKRSYDQVATDFRDLLGGPLSETFLEATDALQELEDWLAKRKDSPQTPLMQMELLRLLRELAQSTQGRMPRSRWDSSGGGQNRGALTGEGSSLDAVTDRDQAAIDRIKESFTSQQQFLLLTRKRFLEELAALDYNWLDGLAYMLEGAASQQERALFRNNSNYRKYTEARLKILYTANKREAEWEKAKNEMIWHSAMGFANGMLGLFVKEGEGRFKAMKGLAVAQAVLEGRSAVLSAWKAGQSVGGPAVAALFAGSAALFAAARIKEIMATTYQSSDTPQVSVPIPAASAGAGGFGGPSDFGSPLDRAVLTADRQRPNVTVNVTAGYVGDEAKLASEIFQLFREATSDGLIPTVRS